MPSNYDYIPVGRPRSIIENDYKLFLKIFYQARKRVKRGNQYDVALEIKKVFLNTYYIENKGNLYESLYYEKNYNPHNININDRDRRINELKTFIKLTNVKYDYSYANYDSYYRTYDDFDRALKRLALYFILASPSAIVQMKKRLLVKLEANN